MSSDVKDTFREKLLECDKHVEKIQIAKKHLNSVMPLDVNLYLMLDDVTSSFIDQLIFRFSKLQDTIGESLFPSILVLSGENVKKKTFIDILNRMEELELIDKKQWQRLREIRNEIAHEYSFNTDEVVDGILDVYNVSNELIKIYQDTKIFCENKLGVPTTKHMNHRER